MLPKSVAIIGAGETGSALAALAALAGVQVSLVDVREDFLQHSMKNINQSLEGLLAAQTIPTEKKVGALDRIVVSTSCSAASRADLIFEALPENEQKKANIFLELDRVCSPAAIFCSNAETIPLERLSARVSNKSRFVGVHFPKRALASRLVEISKCRETAEKVVADLQEFFWFLGLVPIVVRSGQALPSTRLFLAGLNQACRLLEGQAASARDLDLVEKFCLGAPRGLLELADLLGLDYCLEALEALHQQLKDDAFKPSAALVERVQAGHLGVKSGKGFFDYG